MSEDGLVFEQLDETTLEIRDTISNQQYRIESAGPMTVKPSDYDDFPGPVMKSVIIDAERLCILEESGPTVRKTDGDMDVDLESDKAKYSTDAGSTILEFHTSVKSYLKIEGPFEYENLNGKGFLSLSDSTRVILGARAWWCYPNDTITVTNSVDDLREAISHFGDTMLTTSPERSFSTLRGHPPRIQVGESLDIPTSLSKPDTGVTITVPPTRSALLTVAPLAYYLLAPVETGEQFTVSTENGFTYQPEYETLSDAVHSVLMHCFCLDCVVRTEGLYQIDLQERHILEQHSDVNLNYSELYSSSLADRTERYLQVDSTAVEQITPQWPTTAVIEPETRAITAVPYLAYELAQIRPESPQRYTGDEAKQQVLRTLSDNTAKSRSTALVFNDEAAFVEIPETESRQTTWVGEDIPLNAAKFLVEGHEHDTLATEVGNNSNQKTSSGIDVTVICNEKRMARESTTIREILTPREDYPINLSVHTQLSTGQLSKILKRKTDYLHFIGHATPDGLECIDGMLDVTTIEESNVTTFFLNACQSYQQGRYLVEQGSSGGIVTYSDISDTYALKTSGFIMQLLNVGFSIGSSLNIIKSISNIRKQYTIVGSNKACVVQPRAVLSHINYISNYGNKFNFNIVNPAAGAPEHAIGGLIKHDLDAVDRYQVIPSTTSGTAEWDELKEYLLMHDIPVAYEGDLLSRDEFIETIERQRSTNDGNT